MAKVLGKACAVPQMWPAICPAAHVVERSDEYTDEEKIQLMELAIRTLEAHAGNHCRKFIHDVTHDMANIQKVAECYQVSLLVKIIDHLALCILSM